MANQTVIVVLVVTTLVVSLVALVTAFIALMIGERNKEVPVRNPLYKCCDHCGINFPEVGQSYCANSPDMHTEPCTEDGCVKGRIHADN